MKICHAWDVSTKRKTGSLPMVRENSPRPRRPSELRMAQLKKQPGLCSRRVREGHNWHKQACPNSMINTALYTPSP